MKLPLTCVNLIKAIGALSVGQDPVRLSRAMSNIIVAHICHSAAFWFSPKKDCSWSVCLSG